MVARLRQQLRRVLLNISNDLLCHAPDSLESLSSYIILNHPISSLVHIFPRGVQVRVFGGRFRSRRKLGELCPLKSGVSHPNVDVRLKQIPHGNIHNNLVFQAHSGEIM